MTRWTILSAAVAGTMAACTASTPHTAEREAALAAATVWLECVDTGRYTNSWQQAAEYFRAAVAADQWGKSLAAVRTPLGTNISRVVRSSRYAASLPGAPDGEYVVIQFQSSFEHKRTALETVTPMLEKDGEWRVAGYYIK